ncbi:ribonuclease H-like domain-containing protein [Tanacetum coccineum]
MGDASLTAKAPETLFGWKGKSGPCLAHTRQETRNLGLKKITDDKGPVPIRFEWDDKKTMMPLGDHASHWSNYLGELIREMSLYYPSWKKVPAKRKAAILTKIGVNWDAQLAFWNDPRNQARAAQNRQNRAKSTVVCRQGSRSLARLRDQMDEMLRLQRLGSNTETGVPYTEKEIMAIVRKGKQRGHLPDVGGVLSGRATDGCPPPPQSIIDPADVEKLKKSNKSLTKQVKMTMRLFRSDDKFSQMLNQFESSPEFRGASRSSGCGDDEPGGDEDGDEDEEDGDS